MPPQLEKNHVVPTAWQDEALARDALGGFGGKVGNSWVLGGTIEGGGGRLKSESGG